MNPKIARWILELNNHDYTTEHRVGAKMAHVDSLSRCYFVAVVDDNSFEKNQIVAQNLDLNIVKIESESESKVKEVVVGH